MGMNLFIPITKIDEEKRLIYGTIAEEIKDNSGEIFDYQTSKPYFEKWSGDFEKVTEGKSVGNLRAMHKAVAAGKLTSISYDDSALKIEACAKVIDDAEWEKCLEGVYTGFSMGGKYVKKWQDGDLARYTAAPNEVSLVDKPCVPTATFSLVKADGTMEEKHFKSTETSEDLQKFEPTGDLKKYLGEEIYDAKTAMYALSDMIYLYEKEKAEAHPEAAEQMQILIAIINNLKRFIVSEIQENPIGQTAAVTPIAMAEPAGDLLKVTEVVIDLPSGMDMGEFKKAWDASLAGNPEPLKKAGAMISNTNLKKIQAMHDHAVELGAKCGEAEGEEAEKADRTEDLQKMEKDRKEPEVKKAEGAPGETDLMKMVSGMHDTLKKISDENTELKKRLETIEAQPAAPKAALKAIPVSKEEDGTDVKKADMAELEKRLAEMSADDRALLMVKVSHANPRPLVGGGFFAGK